MCFRKTMLVLLFSLFSLSESYAELKCPKSGGILKYGVKAEPPTYDMHGTNSYAVMHFVAQHYSTLLTFDWNNFPKLEGDVAESWQQSSDGLRYTFKIKKGIKFHDGTPLTAADVKATYERLRNPPKGVISVRKALFSPISSPPSITHPIYIIRIHPLCPLRGSFQVTHTQCPSVRLTV